MLQCYSKNATVLQKNVGFFTENHNYWDIWTQMSSFKCGTGILKLPRKKKLGTELGKRILNSIDRAYEEHCIYSIEIHIFHSNSVSIKTQNTLSIETWTRLNSVEHSVLRVCIYSIENIPNSVSIETLETLPIKTLETSPIETL